MKWQFPRKVADKTREIFGKASRECGNYRNLSLEAAKIEARRYLDELNARTQTFTYDE